MTTRRHTLWGDSQQLVIPAQPPVQGPFSTRQLIHVEAPAPATWNLVTVLRRISGNIVLTSAGTNLTALLTIGCGRVHQEFAQNFVLAPNTGMIVGRIADIPAKAITLRLILTIDPEAIFAQSVIEVSAWVAPVVPWEGLQVTPRETTQADESNSLEEVGKYWEEAQNWANGRYG